MLNVMKRKGDGDAPWKLPASSEKESHHQQLVFSTILRLFTIISVSSLWRPSGNQEALQSQSPPACSTLPPSPISRVEKSKNVRNLIGYCFSDGLLNIERYPLAREMYQNSQHSVQVGCLGGDISIEKWGCPDQNPETTFQHKHPP